jgi:hypothetical protein
MKFVPMEGLNRLTDDQLKEYYENACAFLQVPPELGLLYYRFVDTGDAGSQRQLLVKRGACEIIRRRLGISTKSLIPEPPNPDYVAYQAVGVDSSGRQEIAIGAQTTKNKFAIELANAPMAASTKALIRLTLQFAGGGFLWEGEVGPETTQDVAKPVPAQAQIAATPTPVGGPVFVPGRDITPSVERPPQTVTITFPPTTVNQGSVTINGTPLLSVGDGKAGDVEAAEPLIPEEKKRKYTRKSKAVDLGTPQAPPPQVGDEISLPNVGKVVVAQVGETTSPAVPQTPLSVPIEAPAAPPSKPNPDLPNAEELRGFRARHAEYSGVFLRKGGMEPVEGIGGIHNQLMLYWTKVVPNFTDAKLLTKTDWILTLDKLDEIRENEGFEALVKHVQDTIGIKT